MKKIAKILLMTVLLFFTISLSGCDDPDMTTPTNLNINIETNLLTWDHVEGATGYIVNYQKGESERLMVNEFSLDFLGEGEYLIKVKSLGDKDLDDSSWSEQATYIRSPQSEIKYKLINKGTAYEAIGLYTNVVDLVIPDTYNGLPIVSIAEKAFSGRSSIETIKLGNNILRINERCFYNLTKLTSVEFGDKLEFIGEKAFQSCRLITNLEIPNSVTTIENNAFAYCRGLESITLPNVLKSISLFMFSECTSLNNVVIPASVELIDESAFDGCSSLEKVTIGTGVKVIRPYAFNKTGLTEVNIPGNVLVIEKNSFSKNDKLKKVTIEEGTTRINTESFIHCSELSTVNLPNTLEFIGLNAFAGTKLYDDATDYVCVDSWVVARKTNTEDIVIEEGITGLGEGVFYQDSYVKNITLPNSLENISQFAFAKCTELETVAFGNNVKKVDDYAFYNCPKIQKINFPSSIEYIGMSAFRYCEALSYVLIDGVAANSTIKDFVNASFTNVKEIGTQAFHDTAFFGAGGALVYVGNWLVGTSYSSDAFVTQMSLKEGTLGIANYAFHKLMMFDIYLPDSIKHIGKGAFYGSFIQEVEIPESVETLGTYTFYDCKYLESIKFPSDLEVIPKYTFYNCEKLKNIEYPTNLKVIDNYAFYGTILGEITMPDTVEVIGDYAYANAGKGKIVLSKNLKVIGDYAFKFTSTYIVNGVEVRNPIPNYLDEVNIPDSVESIGAYAFSGNENLITVNLGLELKSIGNNAFSKCSKLTTIDLGNVEYIGNYAFFDCVSLEYISLPSSLKWIGDYAFRGTSMTSIVLPNTLEYIGDHSFYGLLDLTIYSDSLDSSQWLTMYNSSYRPMVFGCELSDDGKYVVSFEFNKHKIINSNAINGMSVPTREGYICVGFTTEKGSSKVLYTIDDLTNVEKQKELQNKVLYTLWEVVEETTDTPTDKPVVRE